MHLRKYARSAARNAAAFTPILFVLCLVGPAAVQAQSDNANRYSIIPYPMSLTPAGGAFTLNKTTTLIAPPGAMFRNEISFLQRMIRKSLGNDALKSSKAAKNVIVLQYDASVPSDEGYEANVTSEQVVLKARTAAGMFHAIETLRQLMPENIESGGETQLVIPAVEIHDQPSYAWRGMMLDVSRHFFSTAYLKKFIDMMALYKFNMLHLHLTDDQGWRIEIKKYPDLTLKSGWRTFNNQDSAVMRMAAKTGNSDFMLDSSHLRTRNGRTETGGFYTRQQMKDVIDYALSRHIEIVPEIDMPGHMMAAVKLYPWLTCDGKTGAERRNSFSNPICPCKDSSMQFANDIFSEIISLFPSKYIHIGGDEVEKTDWAKSELCHEFMRKNNIGNLDQLQSFFNDRMQAFFKSHGKTLVGWDEIVEGGIDSSAVVMFWRPWSRMSPLKAARNGNKIVMSPDGPMYFDAFPDRNSLSAVYHYDPTDTIYEMNEGQTRNIIGVQANLWSEMVASEKRADYMVMPRMTALAELGWTHRDMYSSYLQRLEKQYPRLDKLNINYRLPDLPDLADHQVFIESTSFFVRPPLPGMTIRYTMDGTSPGPASPVLDKALSINRSLTLTLAAFTSGGRRGDLRTLMFDRQQYATPASVTNTKPGLDCRIYTGNFDSTTKIKPAPDRQVAVQDIRVPTGISDEQFGLKFSGYIDVPEEGIYNFFLTSNDGAVLKIADRLVVDNDGLHADKEKSGQVALAKGLHPIQLDFTEGGGGYTLILQYSKGDDKPQNIPSSWFKSTL